jgi:hypothetical protein
MKILSSNVFPVQLLRTSLIMIFCKNAMNCWHLADKSVWMEGRIYQTANFISNFSQKLSFVSHLSHEISNNLTFF